MAPRPARRFRAHPAAGARPCPACSSALALEAGEKHGHRLVRCRSCGTSYTARPVTDAELEELYRTYYGAGADTAPPHVDARLLEIVTSWAPFRRTGRLLDVGFGAGDLLRVAQGAGWECWGTEMADDSIARGEAAGWKVVRGDVRTGDLPEGTFDVVALVEVLEHLTEPLAYLERAAALLRPGGLLWGTTPNQQSLNRRVLGPSWSMVAPPEHAQLFSPAGLERLLGRAGFQSVRVRTRGLNPAELAAAGRRLGRPAAGAPGPAMTGRAVNEAISQRRGGLALKRAVNATMAATGLGDSLVFEAGVGQP